MKRKPTEKKSKPIPPELIPFLHALADLLATAVLRELEEAKNQKPKRRRSA